MKTKKKDPVVQFSDKALYGIWIKIDPSYYTDDELTTVYNGYMRHLDAMAYEN